MLFAGACTALLACSTDAPVEPRTPPAAAGPSFEIEDGAHGGNAHFFFLPPLAGPPAWFREGVSPRSAMLGARS